MSDVRSPRRPNDSPTSHVKATQINRSIAGRSFATVVTSLSGSAVASASLAGGIAIPAIDHGANHVEFSDTVQYSKNFAMPTITKPPESIERTLVVTTPAATEHVTRSSGIGGRVFHQRQNRDLVQGFVDGDAATHYGLFQGDSTSKKRDRHCSRKSRLKGGIIGWTDGLESGWQKFYSELSVPATIQPRTAYLRPDPGMIGTQMQIDFALLCFTVLSLTLLLNDKSFVWRNFRKSIYPLCRYIS